MVMMKTEVKKHMNVIYMHTHDSGRYWSPYGYNVPTPSILAFAKEATVFRQCYCAGPTCSPSRAGLLTGYSPHENGMLGLASRGWRLNDYEHHLACYLGRDGYETVLCGIQHEAPDYSMIGYKRIIGSQEFSMDRTEQSMEEWDYANTDEACRYLEEKGQKGGEPFFLSMGWFNTHREFPKVEKDINPDYLTVPLPLYDCDVNRRDMADYHESVRVVDRCFGRIMNVIERAGLRENTVIILTTDHGIAFPQMKCTLYDTGIGVAFIMDYPGNPRKGKAVDALMSQLDVFPTVCELTGIEIPGWAEGNSILPYMEGKTGKIRDEIFSEVTYHAAYEPKRCIRTERYKLIRFFDYHNGVVPANIDEALSKQFLAENGFLDTKRCREYLFDLWLDPMERENLSASEKYADVYNDLSERLEKWMKQTNDPLLKYGSRVPRPEGARVNKLTCLNPRIEDFEE